MINRMIVGIALAAGLILLAANPAAAQDNPQIKKEPIQQTNAASGADMFKAYCSPCHGKDAKGDGPAAVDLKVGPPDLTVLAQKNGGKFPADMVASVLRNGVKAPAHGTAEMPTWGPLFQALNRADTSQVEMRISNLTKYIKSLQVK
jgi:mono/diheme cytochrome c family protein